MRDSTIRILDYHKSTNENSDNNKKNSNKILRIPIISLQDSRINNKIPKIITICEARMLNPPYFTQLNITKKEVCVRHVA